MLTAGLIAAASSARAGDYATLDLTGKNMAPTWIVSLGAGVALSPDFIGSKNTQFSLQPSDFSIRRTGEAAGFGAPDDGFDFTLYEANGFSVGPVASLRDSRSKADDRALIGLRKIPLALDAGLFAEYWPIEDRLRTRIELRQALWGGGGLVARASVDWVEKIGAFTLSGGPRATFGDARFMKQNFAISAEESAANGALPAYSAHAGLVSVGANVAARYAVTPAMSVTVYDTYERLVGDAAASPITSQIGSKNQNTVGINLTYSFGVAY
jgi:outer membrane scaffolding protein for murein synthesis (MipA/OmpV family)